MRMPVILLSLLLGHPDAQATQMPPPERFYILAHLVSDAAPFHSEYVLDIQPQDTKTNVKLIRVAPPNPVCGGIVVKAAEKTVESPPQQLTGGVDLCSLDTHRVHKVTHAAQYQQWVQSDTVGYDIVLQCGSSEKIINLPLAGSVDLDKIRRANPEIASLWQLFGNIKDSVFGAEFDLNKPPPEANAHYRELGDSLVPVLRSGSYGRLLADQMQEYRQGISESLKPAELLNAESFRFKKYVDAEYPALAATSHIQGAVRLKLTVDPESGKTKSAQVLSGNPLLNESALNAARQWEFAQLPISPLEVTFLFAMKCGE